MTATRSRAAALVTVALAALSWWVVQGPLSSRLAGSRGSTCELPGDCLLDADLWGLAAVGIALTGLAWLIVLVGLLGVSAVAIGWLVHRRWPDHPVATATALTLTYGPALLLGAVALWLTTIAIG